MHVAGQHRQRDADGQVADEGEHHHRDDLQGDVLPGAVLRRRGGADIDGHVGNAVAVGCRGPP